MRRLLPGVFALVLGCDSSPIVPPGPQICQNDVECDAGFICQGGVCAEAVPCVPGDCPAGQFCDEILVCRDVIEKCREGAGCECAIVGGGGQLTASGPPTIALPPGARRPIEVVVNPLGGAPFDGAVFGYAVTDINAFSIEQGELVAEPSATPVSAILNAFIDGWVSCDAQVINTGNAPTNGNVRVFAFDELSGEPIVGAEVHLDYDGNGSHDGAISPLTTSTAGTAQTTFPPTGSYTVTIFKQDYNVLSIVGLSATDVALPMSPRPNPQRTAGLTGRVDYTEYERLVLGGQSGSIKFGMVGASFPFKSLLNFDLAPFLGPESTADCASMPSAPGCYAINIPGLINTSGRLPGGVILSLAATDIKSHFDVVGQGGRRYVWALGGETDADDIRDFVNVIRANINCTGLCDLNFGSAINALIPLLGTFGMGLHPSLELEEASLTQWFNYIDDDYGMRTEPNPPVYPNLDDGTLGPLELDAPMNEFVDFQVPNMPPDPSVPGVNMEGLIVLTGIDAGGFGVVPMGASTGVDCTVGDCGDPIGNAANFDGVINGATVCDAMPGPGDPGCPMGVPPTVPDGHVGLFHAPPHEGLENADWITAYVALPISSVTYPDTDVRATATIIWEHPSVAGQTLQSTPFPVFPTPASQITTRSYTIADGAFADLHFVTFEANPPMTGSGLRWNVYFAAGTGTFTAPAVPMGFQDPFAQANLDFTHVGFDLDSGDLESYARNDATTLNDFIPELRGITYQQGNLMVFP